MNKLSVIFALLLAGMLVLAAGPALQAAQTGTDTQGYDVRLTATTIELSFPDGSVLSTPKDFDGKSLDKLSATGGMAKELLDMAYKQMGLEKSAALPKVYSLSQNSPNPFNPSTTITYTIPEGASKTAVRLSVFNLRGQMVRTLVDLTQGPGTYNINWDGADQQGSKVSSGVYFYRLVAGDYVSTRKMVLLK
ncbi:MAG TPA: FlgD immunoglobulin-like domain containing protein [archaeon]|nr:FlgD immunoglobulin-like domain containing protein [archaeon]